jgi:hypothetical protein
MIPDGVTVISPPPFLTKDHHGATQITTAAKIAIAIIAALFPEEPYGKKIDYEKRKKSYRPF